MRDWDRRNRRPTTDARLRRLYAADNPKHYHRINGLQCLVGQRDNEPWFGASCPPKCPGLGQDEEFEPMEEFWRQVAPDALRCSRD